MKALRASAVMIVVAVFATMLLAMSGCGGGGGGTSTPGTHALSNVKMSVEIPLGDAGVGAEELAASINIASFDASGVSTSVASATVTLAYDEQAGTHSGAVTIDKVPVGANYICTVTVYSPAAIGQQDVGDVTTTGTVFAYAGAIIGSVDEGYASQVTVNAESTIEALTALYYARSREAALSDVTVVSATVKNMISTAIDSMIAAPENPLVPDDIIYGTLDPFDPENWNTNFNTLMDGIILEAGLYAVCGNGTPEFGETCDDGNTTPGDGCSADCQNETSPSKACSTTALTAVASAKNLMFDSEISESDYNSAKTYVDDALAASPDCPDANLLGAFVDLMGEANRVGTTELLNSQSIFPILLSYDASVSIARVLAPVVDPFVGVVEGTKGTGLSDDSTPGEAQAELESDTLAVLTGALTKFNKVRTAIASDPDWAFSYPKDPSNPKLGSEYIDKNDIDILTGVYKVTLGFIDYALAYDLDVPTGYADSDPCPEEECDYVWTGSAYEEQCTILTTPVDLASPNTCANADANEDGTITADESLPPAPFGTLRTGGAAYLASAKTNVSSGLAIIATAVDNIVAGVDPRLAGMSMTESLISDVQYYKHYVSELASSFGGAATSVTAPITVDCWTETTFDTETFYYSHTIFDPGRPGSELPADCDAHFTTQAATTARIAVGKIFDITDFRDVGVIPDFVLATGDYDINTGDTFTGIFPDGIQKSWFNEETYIGEINAYIYVKDADNQPIIMPGGSRCQYNTEAYCTDGCEWSGSTCESAGAATLTIDGKSIDLSGWSSELYLSRMGATTLPVQSEYVTINTMFGTDAVLNVTGYEPVTLALNHHGFNGDVVLTPAP
jgi:cysteine-rich repeat protein